MYERKRNATVTGIINIFTRSVRVGFQKAFGGKYVDGKGTEDLEIDVAKENGHKCDGNSISHYRKCVTEI